MNLSGLLRNRNAVLAAAAGLVAGVAWYLSRKKPTDAEGADIAGYTYADPGAAEQLLQGINERLDELEAPKPPPPAPTPSPKPPTSTALGKPSNLRLTRNQSGGRVSLDWNPVKDATAYRVTVHNLTSRATSSKTVKTSSWSGTLRSGHRYSLSVAGIKGATVGPAASITMKAK